MSVVEVFAAYRLSTRCSLALSDLTRRVVRRHALHGLLDKFQASMDPSIST